jgi:hypothetical protein
VSIGAFIIDFISKPLTICFGPKSRKLVMEKTISHVKVCDDLLDKKIPTKTIIAQQEVLARMMKALDEYKHSNNGVKLVAKHTILTSTISVHNSSSRRDVARALGVHHRYILVVLSRHTIIDGSGLTLWSMYIRRKRTDGLLDLL